MVDDLAGGPLLPPLESLFGQAADAIPDLEDLLGVAFDPATPDPGIDIPAIGVDLADLDEGEAFAAESGSDEQEEPVFDELSIGDVSFGESEDTWEGHLQDLGDLGGFGALGDGAPASVDEALGDEELGDGDFLGDL